MLGNRAMIGKLSGFFISGSRSKVADMGSTTSPRGPFDLKVESPRGLKNYDLGGVGLGIVAALEKSCDAGGKENFGKYALCSSIINRCCPKPVSISSKKHSSTLRDEFEEFDSSEDYTYVTCHGHKKSITKVYYDGGACTCPPDGLAWQHRGGLDRFSTHLGQFKNSLNRYSGYSEFPVSDSLSSCHFCRKNLQGKDIYMYRGEKGFCSPECRSRQILMDEQCIPEVSTSADYVTTSPYTKGQIFSTGIVAI